MIIGCTKYVLLAECQWYRNRLRPRGPSQRSVALSTTLWPSLSLSETDNIKDGFRPFPYVKSRLDSTGVGITVDPPNVNRALKTHVNAGYFQKHDGKMHSETHGPNTVYTDSDFVSTLKKLVLRLKPRAIIYNTLGRHNIIERYFRVTNYVGLIRNRHIDVKDAVEVKKSYAFSPFSEREIDDYKKVYVEDQELLKQKSIKDIFRVACLRAKNDLNAKHKSWHLDVDYTRFFINGGIAYSQVQIVKPNS